MATKISRVETELLEFIKKCGKTGITKTELKKQYPDPDLIIVLALKNLEKIGLITEEFARINDDNGTNVVTKLVKAKT